jgi:hypothetical protein
MLIETEPPETDPGTEPTPQEALRRWQLLAGALAIALVAALAALWTATRPEPVEGVIQAGIALDDLTIILPDHPLAAGVPLRLDVTNVGALPHDLFLDDIAATPVLGPGESHRLELGTLQPGVYRLHCDVAGHAEAGMVAELVIADERARDHEHDGDDAH